ncbi:MAG: DUF309 domain-containing protein [Ignavibacteria bacterium]|nr:DUF309 domain-containing protein [Ignavibacteria bacterium]
MNDTFRAGLALFNAREFFDCHDVWEGLWMETQGPDRLFYQGMIQVAVGYYHAGNGNFKGAESQFSKALPKLASCLPAYGGIALEELIPIFEAHRSAFETLKHHDGATFDTADIPIIPIHA